jgi:hypothetical protein
MDLYNITILTTSDDTFMLNFFVNVFSGIVIALFSLFLYRKQKKMDLQEEAKRDILEVLVKIRNQTVKMSATIYHIENHLKWGEEKYSRESILIEHNARLIYEEVNSLIEELKIKMKGVGLTKKYLNIYHNLGAICTLYIGLYDTFSEDDYDSKENKKIFNELIPRYFQNQSKIDFYGAEAELAFFEKIESKIKKLKEDLLNKIR